MLGVSLRGQAGVAGHDLNPPPSSSEILDKRLERRNQRDTLGHMTRLHTRSHVAVKYCGLPLPSEDDGEGVEVRITRDDAGDSHAFFHRLQHCGSPYICPDCAAWLAVRRSKEISQAAAKWVAKKGGQLVFATFTLQHRWGQPLAELLRQMGKAWQYMTSTRKWKTRVDYVGFVRSLEITLGPNGWHPHYHVLLFFEGGVDIPSANEIYDLWAAAVAREGGNTVEDAFSWQVVSPADVQEVGKYIAKWGPGQEVAGGAFKDSSSGLTPWEVLELAGLQAGLISKGELGHLVQHAKSLGLPQGIDWLRLWDEYTWAVRGLRSIYSTPKLRERLELKTDEELMEQGAEDSELVGVLPLRDYYRLWSAHLRHAFLGAVEVYGWDAGLVVLNFAPALGPPFS